MQSNNIVHVLNLPHRTDRLESFKQQAKEQGFEYHRWDGIVHAQPFTGIAKAYKHIIKYAKENKLPYIIIAEDDCIFSAPKAFDYFISQIPADYDIFLSSIYWGEIDENNVVKDFSGFTLSIFNERFYDKFLSTFEQNHIDRQMKIHEGTYKVCSPFVAYQQYGYSDNSGKVTDYNKTYLYGRKFFVNDQRPSTLTELQHH